MMNNADLIIAGKELVSLIKYVMIGGEYPTVTDYKNVCITAIKHNVLNLFYLAIKTDELCPEQVRTVARKRYLASLNQQELQKYYREEIFSALTKEGVKYLPLKGDAVRDMYKAGEMRTSCDIDFFYDIADEEKVINVFKNLEFAVGAKTGHHLHFDKDNVTVEAHYTLDNSVETNGGVKADNYFKNYFENNTPYNNCEYRFNDEELYLYYTMHTAKHFYGGGFGIRTIIDYYVINNYFQEKLPKIKTFVNQFGVEDLLNLIESLINVWFLGYETTPEISDFEEFIFKSGVYGTMIHNASLNTAINGKKGSAKSNYLFAKIFPPYKMMVKTFSWLKKAPILLPFAYVIRWFIVIFKRPENIKKIAGVANEITSSDVELSEKVIKSVNLK